jgi:hypothetical protein
MNERIREIAGQCTTYEYHSNGFPHEVSFDKEKFAELIVRDCMDIAANIGEHGPVAAQEMREHFGIEE